MYCQVLRNDLRAASQHLGIIKALNILNLLDYAVKLQNLINLSWCSWFVVHRNMIRSALEVNGEWGTVEMLALSYIVDKVNNHPCNLHGLKSKTDTCGLVAMTNDASLPPLVLYGRWNRQPTSCSLDCTIPESTIGAYSIGWEIRTTKCVSK